MSPTSVVSDALVLIAGDAYRRSTRIFSSLGYNLWFGLALVPSVSGQSDDSGYTELNSTEPNYNSFVAGPVDNATSDGQKILADVDNFMSKSLEWSEWVARADQIRASGSFEYCIGNLSLALSGVGAAYQVGSSGASTLLTLLPTAGALIGAPAKELWVLYKLVPVAGVLSMMLSLGGNIVPMEVNEYERIDSFSYQGMMGSHSDERPTVPSDIGQQGLSQAEIFANEVHARAMDSSGSSKTSIIALGIMMQLVWLGFILTACWFIQKGSILVWWCTMRPWMYFWFIFVVISSLLENVAGVPFSRQWTIRVSRAPKIRISEDAPWVIPEQPQHLRQSTQPAADKPSNDSDDIAFTAQQVAPSSRSVSDIAGFRHGSPRYSAVPQAYHPTEILSGFKKGYNTVGRVILDPHEPWSAQCNPFYVIISIKGVEPAHAALRVLGKLLSIGVFTVGTAMFASSALVTIMIAVIVASLTIVAGVFGRVTAMWMASEIMQNRPVIHRVVANAAEAEQYVDSMLRKPNCAFEILGHIVVDGRCVKRCSRIARWSLIWGVLAKPFDFSKLAMPH